MEVCCPSVNESIFKNMYVRKIYLEGFRNYEKEEAEFSRNINMIFGENAQGKTNLLESIYFTSFGKSFRTVRDRDMIGFGRDYCRVKADYIIEDEEEKAEIALAKDGRKAAKINGRKVERISEMIKMEFNTAVKPCLIKPLEGNSYEYLILPVRIPSN